MCYLRNHGRPRGRKEQWCLGKRVLRRLHRGADVWSRLCRMRVAQWESSEARVVPASEERLRVWQHQGACGQWLVIQPRATQHRIQDQQHGILGNLLEKQNFRLPHISAWLALQQVIWVIPLHIEVWENTVVERVCGSSLECMQEVVPIGGGRGHRKDRQMCLMCQADGKCVPRSMMTCPEIQVQFSK